MYERNEAYFAKKKELRPSKPRDVLFFMVFAPVIIIRSFLQIRTLFEMRKQQIIAYNQFVDAMQKVVKRLEEQGWSKKADEVYHNIRKAK